MSTRRVEKVSLLICIICRVLTIGLSKYCDVSDCGAGTLESHGRGRSLLQSRSESALSVVNPVTIVTFTSPFHGMPGLAMIKASLSSLKRMGGFQGVRGIIMADSPDPKTLWACPAQVVLYEKYLSELSSKVKEGIPPFDNTLLIKRGVHGGLNGSQLEVFHYVETPLVYVNQHDLVFSEPLDMRTFIQILSTPAVNVLYFLRKNKCGIKVTDDLSVLVSDLPTCGFQNVAGHFFKSMWFSWADRAQRIFDVPVVRVYGFQDADNFGKTAWWKERVVPLAQRVGTVEAFENPLHDGLKDCYLSCEYGLQQISDGMYAYPHAVIHHEDGNSLVGPRTDEEGHVVGDGGSLDDILDCPDSEKIGSSMSVDEFIKPGR